MSREEAQNRQSWTSGVLTSGHTCFAGPGEPFWAGVSDDTGEE